MIGPMAGMTFLVKGKVGMRVLMDVLGGLANEGQGITLADFIASYGPRKGVNRDEEDLPGGVPQLPREA